MFIFKANLVLREIEEYSPQVYKCCKEAIEENLLDLDFQRLKKNAFEKCPNISIDIAVMEKTKNGTVLPLKASWTDIGSWDSVWKTSQRDINNNFIEGKVITKNTNNCYLRSEKRLITSIGVNNLIIIETSDAILVADKSQSQEVKNIVNLLKEKGILEGQEHKRIYRPWGFYESIINEERWQVKIINVKPGEKLSLQKHHHRSEHWIVVQGSGSVVVGEDIILCSINTQIFIPRGVKHRMTNTGEEELVFIEVQYGNILSEDDITRYEDDYNRV